MDTHISESEEQIAKLTQQIEEEKEKRSAAAATEDGLSREDLMQEHRELT